MSSWDGRCFNCRRLMSTCVCYQLRASSQNSNPNILTSGDMSYVVPLLRANRKERALLFTFLCVCHV